MNRLAFVFSLCVLWSYAPSTQAMDSNAERKAWQSIIDSGESNEMNHQWIVAELSYKNALTAAGKFGPKSQRGQASLTRFAACLVVQNPLASPQRLYKRAVEIVYRLR